MRRLVGVVWSALFIGTASVLALGQSSQTGFPQFSSFDRGVDLANLNVHREIPVVHRSGRGSNFDFSLSYDSSIYQLTTVPSGAFVLPPVPGSFCTGIGCPPPTPWLGWGNTLAQAGLSGISIAGSVTGFQVKCPTASATNWTNWTYTDRHGTAHPLPQSVIVSTDPSCGPSQATAYAADQSGYFVTVKNDGSGTAQDLSGATSSTAFNSSSSTFTSSVTDRNGNMITDNGSGTTFTDTLGTTVLSVANTTDSAGNPLTTYTIPAPGGKTSTVVVNYKLYPRVASGFGCSNIVEYNSNAPVALVDNIVLADGTSTYHFAYEPTPSSSPVFVSGAVTGRLQSVTLPTGGVISYSYPGNNSGINCSDASLMNLTVTTSDGPRSYTRVVYKPPQSILEEWTTVTDADGNDTAYNFVPLTNPAVPPSNFPNWVIAGWTAYKGSSTGQTSVVLRGQTFAYQGSTSTLPLTAPITGVLTQDLVVSSQHSNQTDQILDPSTGAVKEVDEYDHTANDGLSAGSLLRKTLSSYAPLGNNILALGSVTICAPGGSDTACNGSGTKVAQTTFGYDDPAPTSTTNITQHGAITGSRGNLTSVHRWLNTSGTTLDTFSTYDDTGNVLTTKDPGGHITSVTYDPVAGCNGAFPTQTTLPDTSSPNLAHHTTSATYDCGIGLIASVTDQNTQITKFSYDAMLRPTEVDYPDLGQTVISYPDPNHVTVSRKIDGSRSTSSTAVLDSYGRVSRTSIANGESTVNDQQDSCYDAHGRLSFKSYLYQSNAPNAAATCPSTLAGDSFGYDALGRTASLTHSDGNVVTTSYIGLATQVIDEGNGSGNVSRILQQDVIGRLSAVCEVYTGSALLGSGGTPGSCGSDIAGVGFLTSYSYNILDNLTSVTQGSLTARSFTYDSLSRMISETTPETGTMSYSYNADSLLATRTRAAANQTSSSVTWTTNYAYDALDRLTGATYTSSDPTNHPVTTPTSNFFYDTSPGWGVTATNTIGRVTEAYTTPFVAGEIFGYDAMGRVLMNHQCTPSTCGASAFSLDYTYDLLGNILTSTNGKGVTFTNSYNVAGRLTGMTSSFSDSNHPGTLLSQGHYSPSAITDTLGNGVEETTNFSTRGLLTSYLGAPVNGQPGTGSVVIGGVLQTYQQQTQAATQSSAVITVDGALGSVAECNWDGFNCVSPNLTLYDAGWSDLIVTGSGLPGAGLDFYAFWQASSPGFSGAYYTAQALADSINSPPNSGPVTASAVTPSGPDSNGIFYGTFTITSTASGASVNYGLTTSGTDSGPFPYTDWFGNSTTYDFGCCSYGISAPAAMSGGKDATFQTLYDNGSTTIKVNNHPDTYPWSGSGTTAASIAQGLCQAINNDGAAFVTATTNGIAGQCPLGSTAVGLVSKQNGQNYSVSASSSSVVNSFAVACPGYANCSSAALTGGGSPAYSFTLSLAPDSQVTSAGDSANGNWIFSYDAFNRLATSNKNSGQQSFTYGYDRYGNRLSQNPTGTQGGPAPQYVFDNNNRISGSGVIYDALGEILTDGMGNSFTWDAEGRLIQVNQGSAVVGTYSYDADGRRVHSPNGEYVYDLAGHMITQLGVNGVWNFGEIYAGGRHLATYSSGTTNFFHPDWLGTKRVMTALNGTTSQTCTGLPFGDGVNCTGTNWTFNGFTDDIHDPETNLEHTQFRKYSSIQGRWLTPDPAGTASASLSDPQSWNRYVYVLDDPINLSDPEGLDGCQLLMGINTPRGKWDWIAAYFGLDSTVYSYEGGRPLGATTVLLQDTGWAFGPARIVADAVNQVQPQTLFYWSGGAQAIASAAKWSMVPSGTLNGIQTTVGISPGTGLMSPLFRAPNNVTVNGVGGADFVATFFTSFHDSLGESLGCKHGNIFCFLAKLKLKYPTLFANCKGRMPLPQIPTIDVSGPTSITPFTYTPLPFELPEFGGFKVILDGECINCIEDVHTIYYPMPGVTDWPSGVWLGPGPP